MRVKCLAQEHNTMSPARDSLAPESSALTMRPLRRPRPLETRMGEKTFLFWAISSSKKKSKD